jgi:hypothetical protein
MPLKRRGVPYGSPLLAKYKKGKNPMLYTVVIVLIVLFLIGYLR